jgi:putative transposase
VLCVEDWAEIRRLHRAEKMPIKVIARVLGCSKKSGHAQRFLSPFSGISPHFRSGRHRLDADEYRREMTARFATWNEVNGTATAA